jgi:hypothetical protein
VLLIFRQARTLLENVVADPEIKGRAGFADEATSWRAFASRLNIPVRDTRGVSTPLIPSISLPLLWSEATHLPEATSATYAVVSV